MHETGIVKSLIHEAERIARHYGAPKVVSVRVRMGALCPFSEGHLREHFTLEGKGTVLEHASLVIEHGTELTDPLAQDIALLSINIEDILPMAVRGASISAKRQA